jgi:predicted dehydrogenase
MVKFRWGIFGTGSVSAKFAAGLRQLRDAEVVMVASRQAAQAGRFAAAFGIPNAIEGYDAAVAAAPGMVDAIYIATPPTLHQAHAVACLTARIPVLIEKPFATDPAAAHAIADVAAATRTFCMEAMWTRFMPALTRLRELIAQGAIGEPRLVAGSFGISNLVDPAYGNFDAGRGGGALAHLGLYPLSLGQWLFGTPADARAIGRIGETGVEEDAAITLRYPANVIGSFQTSLRAPADHFSVHGTHGSLTLKGPIYRPCGIEWQRTRPRGIPAAGLTRAALLKESDLYQRIGRLRDRLRPGGRIERLPFAGNGYHYEAAEVAACVRGGRHESTVMPLADSIAVTETLHLLRTRIFA